MQRHSRLLDPDLLARLGGYVVGARRVVAGSLAGRHRSTVRGSSIEFAEHKEYTPGDEIRHIDWKAYARVDKYYVKQFEEETNLRAYLLVDASASMGYASAERSKLECAAQLAATLAFLLLRQQDSVGLCMFKERIGTYVPPRSSSAHLQNVLTALESAEAEGGTALVEVLRFVSEVARRRSLIFLVSDLFDIDPQVFDLLKQLRSRRHEVIVFHILDHDELKFPFEELTIFEAMEEDTKLLVDPPAVRNAYLQALSGFLDRHQQHAREADIEYRLIDSAQPLSEQLLPFLQHRQTKAHVPTR